MGVRSRADPVPQAEKVASWSPCDRRRITSAQDTQARSARVVRHRGAWKGGHGGRSTITYPPKASRKTVARSSNACSPFPVKLDLCMMASVFGFRSASFLRIPVVIGV